MAKKTTVGIFLAAAAALATNAAIPDSSLAGDTSKDLGGLKEWTTDQAVDEESKLDAEAEELMKEAEEEDYCIPIGEGENCW